MKHPLTPLSHEAEVLLLRQFIAEFLPPQGKLHRNLANEVNYITTTLNRVMLHHFGFRVDKDMTTDALCANRCMLFTQSDQAVIKRHLRRTETIAPSFFGTTFPTKEPADTNTDYIYADIDANTVRTLRLATIPTPRIQRQPSASK